MPAQLDSGLSDGHSRSHALALPRSLLGLPLAVGGWLAGWAGWLAAGWLLLPGGGTGGQLAPSAGRADVAHLSPPTQGKALLGLKSTSSAISANPSSSS
eukprot:COSAG01_NODE_2352_length_7850_cov_62.040898_9_plen_99_part_00